MTKHSMTRYAAFAGIGLAALVGCERRRVSDDHSYVPPARTEGVDLTPKSDFVPNRDLPPKGDEPTAFGGGPLSIDSAVSKIAEARCARELTCGNVGADKKFSDASSCMADVKKNFGKDLNAEDCPAGIDAKELSECVTEAKNEDCGNPFDAIGRAAACRKSDLCKHVK